MNNNPLLAASTVAKSSGHQPHKSQVISSVVESLFPQGSQSLLDPDQDHHSVLSHHVAHPDVMRLEVEGTDIDKVFRPAKPAEPVVKANRLAKTYFVLPQSPTGASRMIFVDRKLPSTQVQITPNENFDKDYFVALHALVGAPGPAWPAWTPNHKGARIPLQHSGLNMDRWRYHLTGYDDGRKEILQLVEFGFPLGLCRPSIK